MKVKVLSRFIDKETKQLHERGSVIDITEPRFHEILSVGVFVEKIETTTVKHEINFNEMTPEELKAYAKECGVKLGNARTKTAIINAITKTLV